MKNNIRSEYLSGYRQYDKKNIFNIYKDYISGKVIKDVLINAFTDMCICMANKYFKGWCDFDKEDLISEALIVLSKSITDKTIFNRTIENTDPDKMASYANIAIYGAMKKYVKKMPPLVTKLLDSPEDYINNVIINKYTGSVEEIFYQKEFSDLLVDKLVEYIKSINNRSIPKKTIKYVVLKLLELEEIKNYTLKKVFHRKYPIEDLSVITILFKSKLYELYSNYMLDKYNYYFLNPCIEEKDFESF